MTGDIPNGWAFADLVGDVYFDPVFVALHAPGGVSVYEQPGLVHAAAKVPIEGSDRHDLQTAWGYGGPLASDRDGFALLVDAWRSQQRGEGAVSEFIRVHPLLDLSPYRAHFSMYEFNRQTVVVELRNGDWRSAYSDSTRNCVKKAARTATIRQAGPEDAALVQSLYADGLSRNRASDDYFLDASYFRALLSASFTTCWIVADSEGPVGAATFLHGNSPVSHYHLSGGNERQRACHGNYLLLDNAIEHFAAEGCALMHLGGGRTTAPDDALLAFKGKFSRLRKDYFIAGLVHDEPAWRRLGGGQGRFLCRGATYRQGAGLGT